MIQGHPIFDSFKELWLGSLDAGGEGGHRSIGPRCRLQRQGFDLVPLDPGFHIQGPYMAIWDSPTGGHLIWWEKLPVAPRPGPCCQDFIQSELHRDFFAREEEPEYYFPNSGFSISFCPFCGRNPYE